MRQTLLTFLLMLGLSVEADGQNSLDALIDEALNHNPQLHSIRHQSEAAAIHIDQVTAWEAPQVGLEFYQTPIGSFPIPTRKSIETDYFVQQMFPWPGKLARMGTIAGYAAKMKEQEVTTLERKLIRDIKTAYYELYLIQRKLDINEESRDLMEKIIHVASKQYEVGAGEQFEVLKAHTERTKLTNERLALEKERGLTEAMLNTLANRAANDSLGRIPELEVQDVKLGFETLTSLAEENRSDLKAMNYSIEMFKAEQALAYREFYPDIMVRGMYKNMSNTSRDFWALMIGFNVPVAFWSRNKYKSKVREYAQHIHHAGMEYKDTQNMIGNDVQSALVRMASSRKQAYETKTHLIPQAETTLKAAIASYQAGKTSFIMTLDSYRMLLMAKLDYHMAVMNAASSEAQLEEAVGMSMDEIKEKLK